MINRVSRKLTHKLTYKFSSLDHTYPEYLQELDPCVIIIAKKFVVLSGINLNKFLTKRTLLISSFLRHIPDENNPRKHIRQKYIFQRVKELTVENRFENSP